MGLCRHGGRRRGEGGSTFLYKLVQSCTHGGLVSVGYSNFIRRCRIAGFGRSYIAMTKVKAGLRAAYKYLKLNGVCMAYLAKNH